MSGNNGRTECGAAHGAPNVNDLPRIATRMCRGWGLSVLKTSRERCRSVATDRKVNAHISRRMPGAWYRNGLDLGRSGRGTANR